MAIKKAKKKIHYYIIMALAVGWIAFITINIATEPDPGTAKVSELAPSVQNSLKHDDSKSLSNYIDSDDSDAIASSYLKKLKRTHYGSLSVELKGKTSKRVLVTARHHGEPAACTTWDVKKKDGRYTLDPVESTRQISCR